MDSLNGHRIEVIDAFAPPTSDRHQPGIDKDLEMVHHGETAQCVDRPTQLAGRPWSLAQFVENAAPALIRQRAKHGIVACALDSPRHHVAKLSHILRSVSTSEVRLRRATSMSRHPVWGKSLSPGSGAVGRYRQATNGRRTA